MTLAQNGGGDKTITRAVMGIHVNIGDFSKILTFIIKPLQKCCLELIKNLLIKVHLISFMVVVDCIKALLIVF